MTNDNITLPISDKLVCDLLVAGVGGITEIAAKQFVDTTGNASLAFYAGAETFRGDELGFVQTASMFFRITGVDKPALDSHAADNRDMRARYFMDEIERARELGEFPCGTRKLKFSRVRTVYGRSIWRRRTSRQTNLTVWR